MSIEIMRELQAYGFFFFVIFLVVVLYGYWFHLKRSEKTGRRDYEQYGRLALDDNIEDPLLEPKNSQSDNAK